MNISFVDAYKKDVNLIQKNKITRLINTNKHKLEKLFTLFYFMFKGSIVALITPFKNDKS